MTSIGIKFLGGPLDGLESRYDHGQQRIEVMGTTDGGPLEHLLDVRMDLELPESPEPPIRYRPSFVVFVPDPDVV